MERTPIVGVRHQRGMISDREIRRDVAAVIEPQLTLEQWRELGRLNGAVTA